MRVLMIGETAGTADLDDPAIPPGLTLDKLEAGLESTMSDMRGRGWDAVYCEVPPEADEAVARVRKVLAGPRFDVVVMGGGLRLPSSRVELFETLVNLVRRGAPDTPLAFNTGPETTADAALRWAGR